MRVLPWNIMILHSCGMWGPQNLSSRWKKTLYTTYTSFAISLVVTFTVSGFIELFNSINDINQVVNNSLMFLTMGAVCYKIVNLVSKRNEIVQMLKMLRNDICDPRGSEEIAMQMKFDARCRRNTLLVAGLSEFAAVAVTVNSFLTNVPQHTLPFKVWLPFDHTSSIGFWIAFLHQILAHAMAATIGSGYDTLFHGIMTQACSQLNILKLRFLAMPLRIRHLSVGEKSDESNVEAIEMEEMKKCVRHHHEILRFIEWSNDIFGLVIFIQYSVSIFVICVSTYTLTNTSFLIAELIFLIVYLMCMLLEIFFMCWNGNEVIVESVDVGAAVYEMDWASFQESTKKDLRMIMIRTLKPIKYTSGSVLALSLDSYNSLMKLSYSMYNLLQRSSS